MNQNHSEEEFSAGDTCVHIWKVYTINCRQAAHQVNAIQCVDRDWKKRYSSVCLSASALPPVTLKGFTFLWVLWKSRGGKQEGCRQLGSAVTVPMWSPAPEIWDLGVVHAASHQGKGRVLMYLVSMLGPSRKLPASVCGRQGKRAGLLPSTVQGNTKLSLCEAISSATIDRTSFLSQGPQRLSPAPSAGRGPKQCGGICTSINRGPPATFPKAPEPPYRWHQCTKTAKNAQKSSRAVLKISSCSAVSRK